MNYKIPGLASIILLFIGLILADYQLFQFSLLLGLLYIVLTPAVFLCVMYLYCRKCPHAKTGTCRHVLFGWLVKKLFRPVEPSAYSFAEITFTLLPLAIYFLLPQYWLFKNTGLFFVFWILALAAIVIVRAGVCTGCMNINCKMCPNAKKTRG